MRLVPVLMIGFWEPLRISWKRFLNPPVRRSMRNKFSSSCFVCIANAAVSYSFQVVLDRRTVLLNG